MKTNRFKLNHSILVLTIFLLLSKVTFSHFGSKGPYGGTVSCAMVYDTTVYIGTSAGGVFSSTKSALVGWKAMPVGLKSGKITALTYTGSYLFAATADSGVYIYTGYVGTDRYWKKINTGLSNLQITSLVAIDSITVMAGTNGGGIFKTINKGANWNAVNNTGLNYFTITGLIKAGNRIIHASDGGIWASDNNGASWMDFNDANTNNINAYKVSYNAATNEIVIANATGLYISSNSSATSAPVYTSAQTGLPPNTIINSISNNGTSWYLATNNGVFSSPTGSINWTSINAGLTTLDIKAVVPFQTKLVAGTNKEGIFKTSASSINWIANNITYNNQETYAMVTSGALLVITATEKGVFVSSDLAASYRISNTGLTDSLHVTDLLFTGTTLYAGTKNAGVFISADTGKTWSPYNNGLTYLNIKKMYASGSALFLIDSNGEVFQSAASVWTSIQAGLPPGAVPTSMCFFSSELILSTYGNGVFTKSISTGNWTSINQGLTNFNTTAVTTNGTKIFVGTDGSGVFVSDFPTVSWSQTAPTVISHTTIMGLNGSKIQAMAYNEGYVFASYKGGLLATSDNGATWIAGGNQFNLPSYSDINKITFVTTRVFVTTENNCLYSNALSELPVLPVGLAEAKNLAGNLFVKPNPNNGNFMVDLSNAKLTVQSICIYDSMGRLVQKMNGVKELLINVSLALNPGIYLIGVDTDKGTITKKIVVE